MHRVAPTVVLSVHFFIPSLSLISLPGECGQSKKENVQEERVEGGEEMVEGATPTAVLPVLHEPLHRHGDLNNELG